MSVVVVVIGDWKKKRSKKEAPLPSLNSPPLLLRGETAAREAAMDRRGTR